MSSVYRDGLVRRLGILAWGLLLLPACKRNLSPETVTGVNSPAPGTAASPAPSNQQSAATPSACSRPTVTHDLGTAQLFPPDNPWNTPIDAAPVDPNSDAILAGSGCIPGKCAGVIVETATPVNVICGIRPTVEFWFKYAKESDLGPYPMTTLGAQGSSDPLAFWQEHGPCPATGCKDGKDHHVLVFNLDDRKLYELYQPFRDEQGRWRAVSGAIFDTKSNALRPNGYTSSDAAGLPFMPGLVRCAEVAAGEIKHALRFTLSQTKAAFVHPATHRTRTGGAAPMGARFRLKASFDISPFNPHQQTILKALKKYGMFVADNGTPFGISAEGSQSCWVDIGLSERAWGEGFYFVLRGRPGVYGSDFEVVKLGTEYRTDR